MGPLLRANGRLSFETLLWLLGHFQSQENFSSLLDDVFSYKQDRTFTPGESGMHESFLPHLLEQPSQRAEPSPPLEPQVPHL